MQEKFTFTIESPRVAKKMIFFKQETESREHVVLKLLAYVLFYDPGIRIEAEIGTHYKPDLVIEGEHGVPGLWIECGYVTVRKLSTIARKFGKTRVIVVKGERHESEMFRRQVLKKVPEVENVAFYYFEPGFVRGMAEALAKTNDFVQWRVGEDGIGIALGDLVFESAVHTL